MSDLLKQVIQDLINDRPEQASVSMHQYIVAKTQEASGLNESVARGTDYVVVDGDEIIDGPSKDKGDLDTQGHGKICQLQDLPDAVLAKHKITLKESAETAKAVADKVMKRLEDSYGFKLGSGNPKYPTDQGDLDMFRADAERKTREGWSFEDIVAYMKSNEAVSPDLDEDTAIARMKKISDKYKR